MSSPTLGPNLLTLCPHCMRETLVTNSKTGKQICVKKETCGYVCVPGCECRCHQVLDTVLGCTGCECSAGRPKEEKKMATPEPEKTEKTIPCLRCGRPVPDDGKIQACGPCLIQMGPG